MLCTFDCLHSLMLDRILMLLVFASQTWKTTFILGTCMILQLESLPILGQLKLRSIKREDVLDVNFVPLI